MKKDFISKAMSRAVELARRGKGKVEPNPVVGAVLVCEDKIVAEAFHQKFGGPHAEALLLKLARKREVDFKKSTLFVTLEPCVSFHGKKTASCAEAILKSGIKHVVYGAIDLNPKVCGRGIKMLEMAGVKVERFDVGSEKPFVAMKVAMSLDGKIATKTGDSKWITGAPARAFVHRLRDSFDAILVGINTILVDDPTLAGARTSPLRIILDSSLRIAKKFKVMRDENVLVVTTSRAPKTRLTALQKRGFKVKVLGGKIEISSLLRFLARDCGIERLLVEGGAEVFGSFVDAKCVDKFYWFIAPKIIGGRNAKTAVGGDGFKLLNEALILNKLKVKKIGDDFIFES